MWCYTYFYRKKIVEAETPYNFLVGSAVHKVLEIALRKHLRGEPSNTVMTEALVGYNDMVREDVRSMDGLIPIIGEVKLFLEDNNFTAKPEFKFSYNRLGHFAPLNYNQDFLFTGAIDLFAWNSDKKGAIIDYKTGEHISIKDATHQLEIYAYFMWKYQELIEITTYIGDISDGGLVELKQYNLNNIQMLQSRVDKLIVRYVNEIYEAMETRVFEPTPNSTCKFCKFMELCSVGEQYAKSEENSRGC